MDLSYRSKKSVPLFKSLDINFQDPPKPPSWVKEKINLFGSYLAGIIDGDGDVRIKRRKYPQYMVRITSGSEQTDLTVNIEKFLRCSTTITKRTRKSFYAKENRYIHGTSYSLEFLISSKNIEFVKRFILPYINLSRKHNRIKNFIDSKNALKL